MGKEGFEPSKANADRFTVLETPFLAFFLVYLLLNSLNDIEI